MSGWGILELFECCSDKDTNLLLYLKSVGAFHDQKFGSELAVLDPAYSYAFDPTFANISDFFTLEGNLLSLASNVYFDYESSTLRQEIGTTIYSIDMGSETGWSGILLEESTTGDSIMVSPELADLDESSLFQDQALEEHRVNGVAVTLTLSELIEADSWEFEDTRFDSYFELSSTEIRLKDGWHFDFVSSNQLNFQKIIIGPDGILETMTASASREFEIRGYDSSGEPAYLFDVSISVTDIDEAWSFKGQEFTAYAYGESFASLSSSDLVAGTVTSTNDLFVIDSGVLSFASDSRYVAESARIENYLHEGFNLEAESTVISYFVHYDEGQSSPGYAQSVTVSDLKEPLESNAVPLNRSGIEDNTVLSSLVSNSWFLDLEVSFKFDVAGQPPSSAEDYAISGRTLDWNADQRALMMEAMHIISSVCGITFVEVEDNADKNFQLVQTISTYAGFSGYPYDDTFVVDADDLELDVLVHELLHTVGIGHPFEAGEGTTALSGVVVPTDPGVFELNTGYWTVMSYGNRMPSALDLPIGTPTPPISTFDVAALQALYGVNAGTHSGDTIWGLPTEIIAIWDGGGSDSIDFSSAASDSVIDLRPASLDGTAESGGYESYSPSQEFEGAYLISRDVEIETAHGGSGDDLIRGNAFDNLLNGGAGDDTIYMGIGSDYAIGSAGNDVFYLESNQEWGANFFARNVGYGDELGTNQSVNLTGLNRFGSVFDGGTGDLDTIHLTGGNDAFFLHDAFSGHHGLLEITADSQNKLTVQRVQSVEKIDGGDGDDLIDMTSLDYTLADTDIVIIGGSGNDIIWAGAGDDLLKGDDGNDILFGGAGSDILEGGSGSDVFQFTASAGTNIINDLDLFEDRITLFILGDGSSDWNVENGQLSWGSVQITLLGLDNLQTYDLEEVVLIEIV